MGVLQEVEEAKRLAREANKLAERHEEQISGSQGLISEMRGVKRALWGAGSMFVLGASGFGFIVLRVVGQA